MDWKHLFTSFEGRIARKHFWLSVLVFFVAGIILSLILSPVLGLNMLAGVTAGPDGISAADQMGMMMRQGWMSLILLLIFIWPGAAVGVKRRHDRGGSGNDVWAFYGLQVIMILLQITGLGYGVQNMGGVEFVGPNIVTTVLGFVMFAFGIYLLVVLGILKGDSGANAYGPDPLDRA